MSSGPRTCADGGVGCEAAGQTTWDGYTSDSMCESDLSNFCLGFLCADACSGVGKTQCECWLVSWACVEGDN